MKKVIFYLIACLPMFCIAQNEGEIIYTEVRKLDIKLPDDMPEEMKARIPTTNSAKKILYFKPTTSLYKNHLGNQDQTIENRDREEGMEMKIVIKQPENEFFKDLANAKSTEYKDLFGKDFLIKGDLQTFAWKMTNETKDILGYPCKKATCIAEKDTVTAWFTMQIPVPNGPGKFSKLPGMILEIDMNSGKHIITANKVELKKIDENVIIEPSKGKKVSQEEFSKIEAKKRKEMEEMNGGRGGGIMIRTEERH